MIYKLLFACTALVGLGLMPITGNAVTIIVNDHDYSTLSPNDHLLLEEALQNGTPINIKRVPMA